MSEFIKGVDISFLEEQLKQGAVFKDCDKTPAPIYTLLKKYGVNGVRFRIWNEPQHVLQSGGHCSVEKTLAAAKIAKENGMNILLDFHYSDFWADPQQQNKPKAWENLTFDQLVQAVYDFTKETLLRFTAENAMPDMVQIGNEIRNGMLWEDGMIADMIRLGDESHGKVSSVHGKPTNYSNLAKLVNAGMLAVKDACKDRVKIMIHLDEGANYSLLSEWFDQMNANQMEDFDVIGLSYYPHFHGKIENLEETVNKLALRYEKPIYIVETAHPWRFLEEGFVPKEELEKNGYPATPEGQKDMLDRVFDIAANIPKGLGRGVYYWEPAIIAADSGYAANMGIFDEKGVALPSIESFRFTVSK
ncbi:arabinogalactan endo-1,4-beta-galactosidase [Anaerotaenia torta]|uniref:glycoside hydrolase family 53 protein n=1 Tax=Anaerotaenia torta TaxID=433293 RepID=UPI003D22101D